MDTSTMVERKGSRSVSQPSNKVISLVLLFIGCLIVAYSFYRGSPSVTVVFIGLTLTLWGILFTFVLPERYVKMEVMESMSISSQQAIDQITSELNPEGKAVYVPFQRELFLKYDLTFQNEFVYISKKNVGTRDTITQAFMKNEEGLRLSPTGLGLSLIHI